MKTKLLTAAFFALLTVLPAGAQGDLAEQLEDAESIFDVGLDPDKESEVLKKDIALMRVVFEDKLRTIAFVLYENDAPLTCQNFRSKCAEGYYNGLAIHRSIEGFLVQTGDPLSRDPSRRSEWGTGGPGYDIPAEKGKKHSKGAVAMARLNDPVNPNKSSHGSQFYISMGKNTALNGKYTVFGAIVKGKDVLEKIAKADVDVNDNPISRIEVDSIRIIPAGKRVPGTVDERILKKERSFERNRKGTATPESERGVFSKLIHKIW